MTKEEKGRIIDELSQKFQNTLNFYITDASGLSVAKINDFRRLCYNKGLEYRVIKNTLIKKALESMETDYSPFHNTALKGFSGVIFSAESGNTPAKVLKEFRSKDNKLQKPILKGASINSDLYIGDDQLDALVALKSKAELVGEIINMLQSPAKNVISALQSGQNKLAGIVKTLSERGE